MRSSSILVMLGLAVLSVFSGSVLAQPVISVDGLCPGRLTFRWDRADPNARAVLFWGRETGQFVYPGFPCTGTDMGIRSPTVLKVFQTGPQGRGQFTAQAAPNFCGGYNRIIVIDTCTLSNVVQLPE